MTVAGSTTRARRACTFYLMVLLALPSFAAVAFAAPRVPQGAERKAILDTLRPEVEKSLGQPVEFVVESFAVSDGWAFVLATPQKPGGGQIQWERTVCSGDVSHLVGALLKQDGGGAWTVSDLALCPTDVAWTGWPDMYGAPADIFRSDGN